MQFIATIFFVLVVGLQTGSAADFAAETIQNLQQRGVQFSVSEGCNGNNYGVNVGIESGTIEARSAVRQYLSQNGFSDISSADVELWQNLTDLPCPPKLPIEENFEAYNLTTHKDKNGYSDGIYSFSQVPVGVLEPVEPLMLKDILIFVAWGVPILMVLIFLFWLARQGDILNKRLQQQDKGI